MTRRGLGFFVFLGSLVLIVALGSRPRPLAKLGKTPLLTIELGGDFSKAKTRSRLLALEQRLRGSGAFDFVAGPGQFRYFLPGKSPVPRELNRLTDEEWLTLAPKLKTSGNAQVHHFDAKLEHCVLRCVPKSGDSRAVIEIENLVSETGPWPSVKVQSTGLKLSRSADLGSSWGSQALSLRIKEKPGYFFDVSVLRIVASVIQRIRARPGVVAARSAPDFVADLQRAQSKEKGILLSQRAYDALRPLLFLQSPKPFEAPCLSRDGSTLSVVILTHCADSERGKLGAWIRSQLSEIGDGGQIEGLPMLRGR